MHKKNTNSINQVQHLVGFKPDFVRKKADNIS